jgi:hypothetical protein
MPLLSKTGAAKAELAVSAASKRAEPIFNNFILSCFFELYFRSFGGGTAKSGIQPQSHLNRHFRSEHAPADAIAESGERGIFGAC